MKTAAYTGRKAREGFIVSGVGSFFKELFKNRQLYILAVPAMLLLFLFNYMPLFGLVIAFKNFKAADGIFGSEWASPLFVNFKFLISSEQAIRAIRNTIFLNALFITIGTVAAVTFALLLNEMAGKWFKKLFQTLTFLPYFISWIVVGVFAYNIFNSEYGSLNNLLVSMGMEEMSWYSTPGVWPVILVFIYIWKSLGYGSVIYMASLSGIDTSYYEAAEIDGATKMLQIRYISLPMLRPTIIILTLLSLGKIMNADFGMFYAIVGDASMLYPTTDVVDTFVYRGIRVTGDVGMASAAGFFQSIISFVLVIGSNAVVRRIDQDSSLF